jgi:hypothetical protein
VQEKLHGTIRASTLDKALQSKLLLSPPPKHTSLPHLVSHHAYVLALPLHLNDDRLQALDHIQVGLTRRVPGGMKRER